MQVNVDQGMLAVLCGLMGATLAKLVAYQRKKMELQFTENALIRKELSKRCEKLELDLGQVRQELDKWQQKYYIDTTELKDAVSKLRIESNAFNIQIRDIKSRKWIPQSDRERYD